MHFPLPRPVTRPKNSADIVSTTDVVDDDV